MRRYRITITLNEGMPFDVIFKCWYNCPNKIIMIHCMNVGWLDRCIDSNFSVCDTAGCTITSISKSSSRSFVIFVFVCMYACMWLPNRRSSNCIWLWQHFFFIVNACWVFYFCFICSFHIVLKFLKSVNKYIWYTHKLNGNMSATNCLFFVSISLYIWKLWLHEN